jgi:hypothetical protein
MPSPIFRTATALLLNSPAGACARRGEKQMKARVTIEYDLPFDNPVVLREREEERWTASATLLSLPESMVVVKVEILEKPFMPAG